MKAKRIAGIAIAISVGALMLPMTAAVADPVPPLGEIPGDGSLVKRIAEAASEGVEDLGELSLAAGLPDDGPASLMGENGDLSVTVTFETVPTEMQLAEVSLIGVVEQVYSIAPAILVTVDPGRVDDLLPLTGVVSVQPVLEPSTGSFRSENEPGTATLVGDPADSCRAIPVEADGPLLSDVARAEFGVDGTGITVGIISDSFGARTTPTTPAADVASGVLPGPGNPCGYTTPVEVLSDTNEDDEGRAMAQLVHGVAPGAKLMFATGWGGGSVGMAQAVSDLAAAGATVIVDDLGFADELAFQQGILSTVISSVRESGVAYYSAAGNGTTVGATGTQSEGLPLNGWMTPEFRSTECPSWVESYSGFPTHDCLDWSSSGAGDVSDSFGFNGKANLRFDVQWGEPAYGVTTRFEAQIYANQGGTRNLVRVGLNGDPTMPRLSTGTQGGLAPGEYELVLVRSTATPDTKPAVSVTIFGDADGMDWREHDRSSGTDYAGFSAQGHAGDGSAVSVAAANWKTPTQPEDFSSLGPNLLIFEPVQPGVFAPSARLPQPELISSPRITAVDGTQTSFFEPQGSGAGTTQYRFFGTSAAAPHAAAVHALAAQLAPNAPAEEIVQAMYATASTMTNPYSDAAPDEWVFGSGLVNAVALLEAVEPPAPEPEPEPEPEPQPEPQPEPEPVPVPEESRNSSDAKARETLAATGDSTHPALLVLGAGMLLVGGAFLVLRTRRVV